MLEDTIWCFLTVLWCLLSWLEWWNIVARLKYSLFLNLFGLFGFIFFTSLRYFWSIGIFGFVLSLGLDFCWKIQIHTIFSWPPKGASSRNPNVSHSLGHSFWQKSSILKLGLWNLTSRTNYKTFLVIGLKN